MSLNLDFSVVLERWPLFLDGAVMTLKLAFMAILIGGAIGTLCAVGRGSNNRFVAGFCTVYVETIRNTPLLVQIFLVYFGLASIGFKFSAFSVAAAALAINVGAYTAEIIRAGFESIPPSQIEAAEGLALSRFQIYWHVILLPAIEKVYPSLTSQFVLLMLASSVTSQISAEELFYMGSFVESRTYRSFEVYALICAIYLVSVLILKVIFALGGRILFRWPAQH